MDENDDLTATATSLAVNRAEWLSRADTGFTREESWELLGWVESAATAVVAQQRPELVELAGFAMALLEGSPLDTRDVMVVASVVRRACHLAGYDYPKLTERGVRRAGALGRSALLWLPSVSPDLPSTHEEHGAGAAFTFRRVPPPFDPVALEQRLLAAQRASKERPR